MNRLSRAEFLAERLQTFEKFGCATVVNCLTSASHRALRIWLRARDFERQGCAQHERVTVRRRVLATKRGRESRAVVACLATE